MLSQSHKRDIKASRTRYECKPPQLGTLGLVLNIIVLWNTIYMDAILDQLQRDNVFVNDEDVVRLSPFGHATLICLDVTHLVCQIKLNRVNYGY